MEDIDATTPLVREHPSRDGVQLVDPIQNTQFTLLTPEPVRSQPCDTDRFYFPVDTAATLETGVVETQNIATGWIRDGSGETVAEITEDGSTRVGSGRYNVELSTSQVNVQLAVTGSIDTDADANQMRFRTDAERIHVGIRSYHEQPAGTVTTTNDPEDVMAALSTLGSALKTMSCERSFPTLRGHPPLIERGDTLSIPNEIERPDTGIKIEVPSSFEFIYPVTPLAYYLGATVTEGTQPRIVTDDWVYSLAHPDGFETAVARVLRQVFLFDCVTRTEGYYDVDLHERRLVEDAVDLDFASLYDRPVAEQLPIYLDVPWEALTDAVPRWKLTADVEPAVEHVSTLPFLADELAVIRCRDPATVAGPEAGELSDQVASVSTRRSGLIRGETRTERTRSSVTHSDQPVIRPADADSIEQAYIGNGIPIGASKMTADAYYRRLTYEPSADPQISVIVVCNDEEMADENVVSDMYGTREWIEFDIRFEEALTATEMRETLRRDADFLHYIGHVDEEGVRCVDGHLDARSLSEVNICAFILNACDSYEQSRALVEHGAMSGIATVTEVNSKAATSVGRTVARLLNQGFSMASTLTLISEFEQIGHHYMVIGDGSLSLVNTEAGTPYHVELQDSSEGYDLSMYGYPRLDAALGTMFTPYIPGHAQRYLNSGTMCSLTVSRDQLEEFLVNQSMPFIQNGELFWSENLRN